MKTKNDSQLAEFSTQELYKELYSREHVIPVIWVDEDIKYALGEYEIDESDENTNKVWNVLNSGNFMDTLNEKGWSYIYAVVEDIFYNEISSKVWP